MPLPFFPFPFPSTSLLILSSSSFLFSFFFTHLLQNYSFLFFYLIFFFFYFLFIFFTARIYFPFSFSLQSLPFPNTLVLTSPKFSPKHYFFLPIPSKTIPFCFIQSRHSSPLPRLSLSFPSLFLTSATSLLNIFFTPPFQNYSLFLLVFPTSSYFPPSLPRPSLSFPSLILTSKFSPQYFLSLPFQNYSHPRFYLLPVFPTAVHPSPSLPS